MSKNISLRKPETKISLDSSLENNISLNLTIVQFRFVSSFERFMTGIILGDAVLRISAEVVDVSSGKTISKSIFDTESETIQGIFGATTPRQLDAISEAIADFYISSVAKI